MLFFEILVHFSLYNYWQLELILDLAIQFDEQMKKVNMGEYEYFQISSNFINSQNYLVAKNLITPSTIAKCALRPDAIINFYPEIESYDPEYAKLAISQIFSNPRNQKRVDEFEKLFGLVRSNPEQHQSNRLINYHPSTLHKSIRDDDISTFQQLLSQNNINLNSTIEKSIYERTSTTDRNLSLIQTAALYGSLRIFKFLWMQSDIQLDENLQFYSYSGRNMEIIHICEQKCSFHGILQYALSTHQNELVEYYLENFESELEDDPPEYKEVLKKFEEDDQCLFKKFNYRGLKDIVSSMNYQFLVPCLPKIVFLIENYENNSSVHIEREPTLLGRSCKDFNLFKFLYSHKNPHFKFSNDSLYPYFFLLYNYAPSSLLYLLENENENPETFFNLNKYMFFLKKKKKRSYYRDSVELVMIDINIITLSNFFHYLLNG